jgi:hypothetical protein
MAALCTLEQVKDRIGISGSEDDDLINGIIASASRAIMVRYGREFVPRTDRGVRLFVVRNRWVNLRSFDLRLARRVTLHPGDASAQVLIENQDFILDPIGGDELTGTYLALKISDAVFIGSDYTRKFGKARLQIIGDWGVWNDAVDVAPDIVEAAIETTVSWLDRGVLKVTGANTAGEPHGAAPATTQGWDIPLSAHRKLMLYSRNLGVY